VVAIMLAIFGFTDIASGAAADPAIPLGLTGQTIEELRLTVPRPTPSRARPGSSWLGASRALASD
jgi:hypothetical protein